MPRVNRLCILFAVYVLAAVSQISCNTNSDKNMPPEVKKKKHERIVHGDTINDDYYWMRERESSEVAAHLSAENEYTKKELRHTEALQRRLFDEITARIKAEDKSVPYYENGYLHYLRYESGKEHPIYCRKKSRFADEEVLIDLNKKGLGLPFYELGDYNISPNNRIIAYSEDTLGRRIYNIKFKDLETGKEYPEVISQTDGNIIWANDNKSVFYIRKDSETLREYEIRKHILGQDTDKDEIVYTETDETFNLYLYKSKSDKYIVIGAYSTLSVEHRIIEADFPQQKPKVFSPRRPNLEYYIEHCSGKNFYVLHNHKAANFSLSTADINNTELQNWETFLPYDSSVFIEDFELFRNYVVLKERIEGLIKLHVVNTNNKSDYYINFKDEVYEAWISDNYDADSNVLRFGYSSLTNPTGYYDFDLKARKRSLLKQAYAGDKFSAADYETKRLYAEAKDGTKIPISLVHKKGLKRNGKNPLLIYGYGSYGYSVETFFKSSVLSLLERGFVYAVAHVRGGQELGRAWYENGKLLKKRNTFTDFIACTDYLFEQGYSQAKLCFARGGSAGGLLVGAVANMAPEKYAGIVAEVPFVDVVTSMLDKSVPLTTGEYDEWGNPEQKQHYKYMLSYSPYDNVKRQNYPAMLITAGLHDSQVQYWEPAKWAAKLREYTTGDKPVYLYTETEAGHEGLTGRYKSHKETAMIYAFLLDTAKQNMKKLKA